jgi:hypothetical protein
LVQRGFTLGAAAFGEFGVFKMGKMIVHELHGLRNDEVVGLSVRAGGVSLYMLDLYFTLVMSLKANHLAAKESHST